MKLYHYDHCPYCAKARMIFGLKDIDFKSEILLNDDEQTPVKMIGVKELPILQKKEDSFMGESLDIIKYVDTKFGGGSIISYSSPKQEIKDWLYSSRNFAYDLAMPRWVQMPLDEFKTQSAKDYFQNKKEKTNIGSFSDALKRTATLMEKAESELKYLENLMLENGRFYIEELHIDDFHIFATLRNLTTVKDLKWPNKLRAYLEKLAQSSKVNLFFDHAI